MVLGVREPTYFILLSLLGEPRHGYAIARRSEELSDGRVRLAAGTLYGALDRLVDQGLIAVEREETVQGRRRRTYRIEEPGRRAVIAEVERMRASVAAADDLDPIGGPGSIAAVTP
ncbi:MAG: PadR family transcriptional regulator [Actinomycetota bacterium]